MTDAFPVNIGKAPIGRTETYMEEKKVFKYIKRLIPYVLIISLALSLFINFSLKKQRTYVASAVINYNFESAEKGKTPADTDLDVGEIKSSAIMSKVIEKLSLPDGYSPDKLSSRVTITEVPDPDKEEQKAAKLKEGEEYTYVPTKYIVEFAATNSEGKRFAQTLLDEILDTYFSVFGEKYINVDHISNNIDKLYDNDYDYLSMAEQIDNTIENTVNALYQRDSAYPYYRSTETGTSFGDLIDEFNFIRTVNLKDIFSKIYRYQITKSKSLLNADYNTRIDNNAISGSNEREMFDDIEEVIDAYVFKMRESGNTDITSEYILNEVHNKDITDGEGNVITKSDQTVTYDQLIYAWRDHDLNDALAIIDTAYCRYVLDTFNTCTGACGGSCGGSDKTCAQLSNSDYTFEEQSVKETLRDIVDKLTVLYDKTVSTNSEYNEYLGCKNISILSTASTTESINVTLYSVIAFFFIMVVCCGGLILIGRMNDIVIANFYTDKKTGFFNRAYFDKYLQKKSRTILDDGTVMISVSITNQRDINKKHGRKAGDEVIELFAKEIKTVLSKSKAMLVYNENSHFIAVLEKSDSITAEDMIQNLEVSLENREICENIEIRYKAGVAETFRERIKSPRALLVEAIKNSREFDVKPRNE